MGPRAKRRLVGALLSLVVIAAVVGLATLITRRSASGSPAGLRVGAHVVGTHDAQYYKNSTSLAFGMTKQEVRSLVGAPTRTDGRCWQYEINVQYPANQSHARFIWNADRVCFDGGRYSESHEEMNGKWDSQGSHLKAS
jgi:hypothetical protein